MVSLRSGRKVGMSRGVGSSAVVATVVKKAKPLRTRAVGSTKKESKRNYTQKKQMKEVVETKEFIQTKESIKTQRAGPEKWQEVMRLIEIMRAATPADVDRMGVETFYDSSLPEHVIRFHVLLASMLSSQTKDPVVYGAMVRLREKFNPLTVEDLLNMKEEDLAAILRPVGFFNRKAIYIKEVCRILRDNHSKHGIIDIPSTYDELVALPGVGPKMAHLVMTCAWNNTQGICVDIHVHRIANRLGWAKTWKKNQDPEKTREALEEWLPFDHWAPINPLLVGFGQTICTPLRPKCSDCQVNHLCPSAFKNQI